MQAEELQKESKEFLITYNSYATSNKDGKMKTDYDSGTEDSDQFDCYPKK